ncbi:MAG: hypothetical protein OXP09_10785 [Gammaproteobacteria bacterium]|nr:hypothetical protein [Gammaproteobacteria bacterium]MDE0366043.1 hypothetical protein [Gammaproteobacteria bacterium]
MPVVQRLLSLLFGCVLSVAASSLAYAGDAAPSPAAEAPESAGSVSDSQRGNICFGGLDDGKLIPNDDRIDNPFRQTTLLGCSVEGGEPVFLPDLKPAIPNGVLA